MYGTEIFTPDKKCEEQKIMYRTPIEEALGVDEKGMTTAKKLYAFLELNPSNYSKWCKTNITENEFATENEDYWVFVLKEENPLGGRPTQDYKLTAHFAKKLSQKGNGVKAEEAREYFTTLEERVKQKAIDLSQLSPDLQMFQKIFYSVAKQQMEQKRQAEELETVKSVVETLNARITTHNEDYFSVAGYASLRGINIDINRAGMLGRKATKISREYGYEVGKVKDPRFGTVNTYHVDVLKEVFDKEL